MKKRVVFWILSVLITALVLIYQRLTGPTYAVSGKVTLNERAIPYTLDRSHPGPENAPVRIKTDDPSIQGVLYWKRYNTEDEWTRLPMSYSEGYLEAELPHQPPAGKLTYRVELRQGDQQAGVPGAEPIIIRFKGDTPIAVVIPHVLAMFLSMLFGMRAGFEFFMPEPKFKALVFWTVALLVLGGFILGPLMQHYAFNAWWTGWPVGTDLTDNKTAVALIAWILAAVALYKAKNPKRWVLGAAIVMIAAYVIPHSILGSELDYKALDKERAKIESTQ